MPGSTRLRALAALAAIVATAAAGLVPAGPASADPDPAPVPPSYTEPAPVDPGSRLTEFPLPNPSSLPNDVLAGADGSVWVSTFADKQVLRMSRDGVITATAQLTGGPSSLATDGEGGAWAAEYASNAIAHVSASGVVTEYPIPTANSFPAQVYDAGDLVFFTESNTGKLGRLTRSTGAIVEYPIPGAKSLWAIDGISDRLLISDADMRGVSEVTHDGIVLRSDTFGGESITGISGLKAADGVYSGLVTSENRVSRFVWPKGSPSFAELVGSGIGRARTRAIDQGGRTWFIQNDSRAIVSDIPRTPDSIKGPYTPYTVPSVGDLSGLALTDGRFLWAVDQRSGHVLRLDSVVDLRVTRHGGVDRYDLASTLVHDLYPKGSQTVFIASGETFPDALSVGPIAAQVAAPVLLTQRVTLPETVRREVIAQNPKRVFVVGGPASISESTLNEIRVAVPSAAVERIGGADRFAVSRALQDRGLIIPATDRLSVTDGRNFPDALSAAPLAAIDHSFVLLVDGGRSGLQSSEAAIVTTFDNVRLIGGPNSISKGIEDQAGQLATGGATRIGGLDRFDVSNAVAAQFGQKARQRAYLASGSAFADALAGGAVAGRDSAPLLLAHADCIPPATLVAMLSLGVWQVELLGGERTLDQDVMALKECA